MKKRYLALGIAGLLVGGAGTAAYVSSPTVSEGTTGEAPELGRQGEFAIGTVKRDFILADRTSIDGWGAVSGSLNMADRTVSARIWYPADETGQEKTATYPHTISVPGKGPVPIASDGFARPDAAPLAEGKFPLVLMSHGFRGWDTQFSNLGEHIASHGYVVVSINHADLPVDGMTDFLLSFGNVLVDRTLDQRQILAQLLESAQGGTDPILALADSETVGLVGYSMGGYGALATAGAAYDFAKDPLANIPEAAREQLVAATAEAAPVDALVTFAPWGGQPDNRAWTAESLAGITVPSLMIVGNQDDVVDFKNGASWLFDAMTGSDRHMLVYREARHNIVGNAFRLPSDAPFAAYEYLNEPVWRSERLNMINQHFVTAFLDLHLKGDEAKAAYLNVPTQDSNDATWETAFGDQLNGTLAGDGEEGYWRGFQRRWLLGVEMRSARAD